MANITQYEHHERMDKFRIYYNETIYPELVILERERRKLILLMFGALIIFLALGYLAVEAHVPALTLFLWVPVIAYGSYIGYRIGTFRDNFKPRVVDLILDFIDEGQKRQEPRAVYKDMEAARRRLRYDYKKYIPLERFQKSGIFVEPPTIYKGEDYIEGSVGSAHFEMCELDVRKLSYVRPGYEPIFRGVFFYSNFHRALSSSVVILPKGDRQFLMSTIKGITKKGGRQVMISDPIEFNDIFLVYTNSNAPIEKMLTKQTFDAILNYQKTTDKEIYVSIVQSDIYLAVSNSKDILEPRFLSSNVRFELVKEFFEDLMLIISIIEDFDLHY